MLFLRLVLVLYLVVSVQHFVHKILHLNKSVVLADAHLPSCIRIPQFKILSSTFSSTFPSNLFLISFSLISFFSISFFCSYLRNITFDVCEPGFAKADTSSNSIDGSMSVASPSSHNDNNDDDASQNWSTSKDPDVEEFNRCVAFKYFLNRIILPFIN